MTCLARQHSDQMICHQCGLVWDVNDPEPPVCANTLKELSDYTPCAYVFRGAECGYDGEVLCDKTFESCPIKDRFGGFPWRTKR